MDSSETKRFIQVWFQKTALTNLQQYNNGHVFLNHTVNGDET